MLITGLPGLLLTSTTGANAQWMPSARPSRAATTPGEVRGLLRARGPDGHRVRDGDHAAADAERHPALHVRGDEQGDGGGVLQLVQQRGQRLDLGLEHHHAADAQPADLVEQRAPLGGAPVAEQAEGAHADHLRRPCRRGSCAPGSSAPTGPGVGAGRGGRRGPPRPRPRPAPGAAGYQPRPPSRRGAPAAASGFNAGAIPPTGALPAVARRGTEGLVAQPVEVGGGQRVAREQDDAGRAGGARRQHLLDHARLLQPIGADAGPQRRRGPEPLRAGPGSGRGTCAVSGV